MIGINKKYNIGYDIWKYCEIDHGSDDFSGPSIIRSDAGTRYSSKASKVNNMQLKNRKVV
jgi:hypothetical protein